MDELELDGWLSPQCSWGLCLRAWVLMKVHARGPEEGASGRGQARADLGHAQAYQHCQQRRNDPPPDHLCARMQRHGRT